jgi:hypothetical protein
MLIMKMCSYEKFVAKAQKCGYRATHRCNVKDYCYLNRHVLRKYRQRELAASSGKGPVADSFEHGKEASDATECRLLT